MSCRGVPENCYLMIIGNIRAALSKLKFMVFAMILTISRLSPLSRNSRGTSLAAAKVCCGGTNNQVDSLQPPPWPAHPSSPIDLTPPPPSSYFSGHRKSHLPSVRPSVRPSVGQQWLFLASLFPSDLLPPPPPPWHCKTSSLSKLL